MKLILSVLLLLAVFAQDTNSVVVSISGTMDRLLDDLKSLLVSSIKDVRGLLTSLDFAVSNLVSSVLETVFNLIDNLLSSVDGLLAEARSSEKVVNDCEKRGGKLVLLKQRISHAVDECRKNFGVATASALADLKKEQDRAEGSMSTLTKSLQNCVKGLFVISCISKAQQSSLKEIQGIVNNVEILGHRISPASDEVMKCLKDVNEDGRKLANQIYSEIQLCISEAPHGE